MNYDEGRLERAKVTAPIQMLVAQGMIAIGLVLACAVLCGHCGGKLSRDRGCVNEVCPRSYKFVGAEEANRRYYEWQERRARKRGGV